MTSNSQEYSTGFTGLIERLAVALESLSIDYMIVGGQAVLLYGEPRLTKDIDVTLALDSSQLSVLLPIVDMLKVDVITENAGEFVRKTSVMPVRDIETGIRIDFIFSFTPYERQAIGHARKKRIGKTEVAFATMEDVIIHKLFAGRARDIEDIRSILIKNRTHDADYIRKWLRDFDENLKMNTSELYQRILSE